MRSAIVILTLCAVALAQESAAELFYKAFWLEQAEGKGAEAADLYNRILVEYPDAPEVPRVLLGMARIEGHKSTHWLARLRAEFPDSDERQAAEKLVSVKREPFKPNQDAPSAIERKLSHLYYVATMEEGNIQQSDRELLVELGVQAQPMLRELLHQTEFLVALSGARGLMSQQLASSERILIDALEDPEVLYKNAIVMAFAEDPCVSEELIDAMIAYHGRSRPPRTRNVVWALAKQLSWKTPGHEKILKFLTDRILNGPDEEIEYAAAARPRNRNEIPDAYLDAIFRNAKWAMEPGLDTLVLCADRPNIAKRTLMSVRTFLDKDYEPELRDHSHRRGSLQLMADIGLAFRKELPEEGFIPLVDATLGVAVRESGEIATEVILLALEEDHDILFESVRRWMWRRGDPEHYVRLRLGEKNLKVSRRAALESHCQDGDIAGDVLLHLGLDADDLDMAVEIHRAHPEFTNQAWIFRSRFVSRLKPEQIRKLAAACHSGLQAAQLLDSAEDSLDLATVETLLSRDGNISWHALKKLPKRGQGYAELVARWLLDQTCEGWGWKRFQFVEWWGWRELQQVDGVREALLSGELRKRLMEFVVDERTPIASLALEAALEDSNQKAIVRALDSPVAAARKVAIRRIEDPNLVVSYYDLAGRGREDQLLALERLGEIGHEGVAEYLAGVVKAGEKDVRHEWLTWLKLQPRKAAHHAVQALNGTAKAKPYREVALEILTRSDLPQRIDIFRKILAGHAEGDVGLVLQTVRDQYLVELGVEALGYLRNPDEDLRAIATQAIERIKFYAEAKKALETQPVIPATPPRSR